MGREWGGDMGAWGNRPDAKHECWDWMNLQPPPESIALQPGGKGRWRRGLTPTGGQRVYAVLTETASKHQLDAGGELTFKGLFGIYATPRCERRQEWHTDYQWGTVAHLRGTPTFPRSAIWAACAPFRIECRDRSCVNVPVGHVVFFLADFWHAGGAWMNGWPRFHGFLAPRSVSVPDGVYGEGGEEGDAGEGR